MSELGDLLELLHGARGRYRTVRATIRPWLDLDVSQRAFERNGAVMASRGEDGSDELEAVLRLWLERPDRWREELECRRGAWEPRTIVVDGDTWWLYQPSCGAMSNEGDPGHGVQEPAAQALLDPAPLLGDLDFHVIDRTTHRGRAALRVRARARGAPDEWRLQALGFGAAEYELLVDAERGVLLHSLALFEGEPLALFDMLEIAFDEAPPPGTFAFEPPAGELVRGVHRSQLREVTIERAAELAPFPVWVPSNAPYDWVLRVVFLPGEEAPPVAPTVSVHYASESGEHVLTLTETPSGHPGWAPYRDANVLERDGTQIQVVSDLDAETLERLLASLVQVGA